MRFCDWTEDEMGSDVQTLAAAFGDEGRPDEMVQGFLSMDDSPDGKGKEWWVVYTTDRWALIKPPGFIAKLEVIQGELEDLAQVGVGMSHHHEQMGFTSEDSQLVTFTFELFNGNQYQRHFSLGSDENQVNESMQLVRSFIEGLSELEIPVVDGPGWDSSGGYSAGYGIVF